MMRTTTESSTVYLIETPKDIFWSRRKQATQYEHVKFLWRDKAFYREIPETKFIVIKSKTTKKVWELV
jgi:hypothetical protein